LGHDGGNSDDIMYRANNTKGGYQIEQSKLW